MEHLTQTTNTAGPTPVRTRYHGRNNQSCLNNHSQKFYSQCRIIIYSLSCLGSRGSVFERCHLPRRLLPSTLHLKFITSKISNPFTIPDRFTLYRDPPNGIKRITALASSQAAPGPPALSGQPTLTPGSWPAHPRDVTHRTPDTLGQGVTALPGPPTTCTKRCTSDKLGFGLSCQPNSDRTGPVHCTSAQASN